MQDALFTLEEPVGSTSQRARRRRAALSPLLKWPGGKGGELDQILRAAPRESTRFFEPFVGGGAVFWAMPADTPSFINDLSDELILLYRLVQQADSALEQHLSSIDEWWNRLLRHSDSRATEFVPRFITGRTVANDEWIIEACNDLLAGVEETVPDSWHDLRQSFVREARASVPKKIARMQRIEVQRNARLPEQDLIANLEGALKAACYTTLRTAYNAGRRASERSSRQGALFFFLREYSYAAMFRFNARGDFNVPYGGISYNRKDFRSKIDHMFAQEVRARFAVTHIECLDFEAFVETHQPEHGDFMFLDPPYDSDFSDYDLNSFGRKDHERLASVMRSVPCAFQLVIKATPAVEAIYNDSSWNVSAFDKTYMWTIKERNDRSATHLMIRNYET